MGWVGVKWGGVKRGMVKQSGVKRGAVSWMEWDMGRGKARVQVCDRLAYVVMINHGTNSIHAHNMCT